MYSAYGALTGLTTIDSIANSVFTYNFSVMLILALAFSCFVGLLIKSFFRESISIGEVWDDFCGRHVKVNDWVSVYTKDKLEFKGRLMSYGFGESRQEIVIYSPKLIWRNSEGEQVADTELGHELIFTEGDVSRMAALTSIEKKPLTFREAVALLSSRITGIATSMKKRAFG